MRSVLIAVSFGAILAVTALASSPRALADAPAVGSVAPSFALQDQNGETHKLSDYKGSWVVLYFYPKDDTPGCTTEACSLRDNIFAYRRAGATILGISVDDVESHKAFASKHSLPFTLLADPTKQTARDYGVLVKMLGVFEVAQRDTYLIDPQGRIVRHWPKVDPKDHSDMVLKELLALQAGKPAP
jgi:thioredoxin-dependent peroxiredoxin